MGFVLNSMLHTCIVNNLLLIIIIMPIMNDIHCTVCVLCLSSGALHRQAGRYSTAVDEYLTAINKCSHNRDSAVYKDALRQLTLTYNDFAVDCFK